MKLAGKCVSKDRRVAFIATLLFVALNSFLLTREFFFLALLPAALFIGLLYFTAPDKILIFIAFLTPLAVNLSSWDLDIGVSLPTEPLLAALLLLVLAKILYERKYDRRLLLHPLSLALYFYFFWMLISTLTSQFPVVSLKAFIAKLWFIVPVYFLGVVVFRKEKNILNFIFAYISGFIIVIIYTLINHYQFGFTSESAHWVMTPFYNDHTSYGAMLAMFIPFLTGTLFMKSIGRGFKWLLFGVLVLFVVALVLSVSRAAWASVVMAAGIWFLIHYKIKFKWLVWTAFVFAFLIFANKSQIIMKLEKNKQDAKGSLVQHVESVSNVATDASNLERLNRWSCALRMFALRPVFGFGPGTYQFVYGPLQKSYEKTVISTNTGTRGTAHSEYLLILSEEGLPGIVSLLLIFSLIIYFAAQNVSLLKDKEKRTLNILLLLGISTYMVHAFFNNFLDTDKAAVPFWGFAAAIVAMNLQVKKEIGAGEPKSPK